MVDSTAGSASGTRLDAVQRLLDERDIIALAVDYAFAIDEQRWDDLFRVFTADCTAWLGSTELSGPGAIAERCRTALEPLDASHHLIGTHDVVLDGNRATHRCYLQAQHVRGDEQFLLGGRYEDECVRVAEGWRIARRVLTTMWTKGSMSVIRGAQARER